MDVIVKPGIYFSVPFIGKRYLRGSEPSEPTLIFPSAAAFAKTLCVFGSCPGDRNTNSVWRKSFKQYGDYYIVACCKKGESLVNINGNIFCYGGSTLCYGGVGAVCKCNGKAVSNAISPLEMSVLKVVS